MVPLQTASAHLVPTFFSLMKNPNKLRFTQRTIGYVALQLMAFLCLIRTVSAQNDPPAGIVPFSTQVVGLYDSVDMATGGITFQIPVRSKIGKIPLSFKLVANQAFYTIPSGNLTRKLIIGASFQGEPFGAQLGAEVTAHLFGHTTIICNGITYNNVPEFNNLAVRDTTGTSHPLGNIVVYSQPCGTRTTTTMDGSGYTVVFTDVNSYQIYDRFGNGGSDGPGSTPISLVTDPDGATVSGSTAAGASYKDSLGETFMTNSATAEAYEYTDAAGNTQTIQVNGSTYTQATNFGCPVSDVSPTTRSLDSSITLADGSSVLISYEPTPGKPGDVTGRISKLTFSTGGSVAYTYTGGNNGIDCTSEVVPTLTRHSRTTMAT